VVRHNAYSARGAEQNLQRLRLDRRLSVESVRFDHFRAFNVGDVKEWRIAYDVLFWIHQNRLRFRDEHVFVKFQRDDLTT